MGEAIGLPLGKLRNPKAAVGFVFNLFFPLAPSLKKEIWIVMLLSLRLSASPVSFSFLVHKHGDVAPKEDSEQEPDICALACSQREVSLPARKHHPSKDVLLSTAYQSSYFTWLS